MQPAQHAANNFPFLLCGLQKIKAFSSLSALKAHLLGTFLRISWLKI